MKRYAYLLLLAATWPLVLAVFLGGEAITQLGFRLAAIENGVALASRHWSYDGYPDHEAEIVARVDDDEPVRKPTPSKRGKR